MQRRSTQNANSCPIFAPVKCVPHSQSVGLTAEGTFGTLISTRYCLSADFPERHNFTPKRPLYCADPWLLPCVPDQALCRSRKELGSANCFDRLLSIERLQSQGQVSVGKGHSVPSLEDKLSVSADVRGSPPTAPQRLSAASRALRRLIFSRDD